MHIQDRTFIVSGGGSGLGLATVQDLHSRGAYVAIFDLNANSGAAVVKELGDRARFWKCDVSSTDSVEAAVHAAVEWSKETHKQLAGVLAAAGVGSAAKLVDRHNKPVAIETIDFVLGINVRGTLDLLRLCVPHMTTNDPLPHDGERGVLIMVSSSAAFDGQPGQVAYAASKGAIRAATLPLARDLAQYGIRVMTIAPAFFESGMTSLMGDKVRKSLERVFEWPRRPGLGAEFAQMVRSIIENPMLNGECIRLDGATRMASKM